MNPLIKHWPLKTFLGNHYGRQHQEIFTEKWQSKGSLGSNGSGGIEDARERKKEAEGEHCVSEHQLKGVEEEQCLRFYFYFYED